MWVIPRIQAILSYCAINTQFKEKGYLPNINGEEKHLFTKKYL